MRGSLVGEDREAREEGRCWDRGVLGFQGDGMGNGIGGKGGGELERGRCKGTKETLRALGAPQVLALWWEGSPGALDAGCSRQE